MFKRMPILLQFLCKQKFLEKDLTFAVANVIIKIQSRETKTSKVASAGKENR